MDSRSNILADERYGQRRVNRIEAELNGVKFGNLITCDRTYTFFLNGVTEEHVTFIGCLHIDINANTRIYNRVGQPLAFLLDQLCPLPVRCVFRIVTSRDGNAYLQMVFFYFQYERINRFFRRLQANILLVLFAF